MSDAQAAAAGGNLSHREIQVIFFGLMAGMLVAALDQTVVSTALPTIVGDLGGLEHLSWVVTAYLLSSTISVPVYGKVSDLLGEDAARSLEQLAELARQLEEAGLIEQRDGRLELTPRGVRKIGQRALGDLYTKLLQDRPGGHRIERA